MNTLLIIAQERANVKEALRVKRSQKQDGEAVKKALAAGAEKDAYAGGRSACRQLAK